MWPFNSSQFKSDIYVYDMIWYDMIWYDMIWYDTERVGWQSWCKFTSGKSEVSRSKCKCIYIYIYVYMYIYETLLEIRVKAMGTTLKWMANSASRFSLSYAF